MDHPTGSDGLKMIERKKIEVYEDEYNQLCDDSFFLECLRNAGVDNWEWYGAALDEYHASSEENDE